MGLILVGRVWHQRDRALFCTNSPYQAASVNAFVATDSPRQLLMR
jgi:hypothetical protein